MACLNGLCEQLKKAFLQDKLKIVENNTKSSSKETAEDEKSMTVNVNPFVPIDKDAFKIKNIQSDSDAKENKTLKGLCARKVLRFNESYDNKDSPTISLSLSLEPIDLSSTSVSRYKCEFQELELVGNGEFGSVYRCLNRLDGCVYAIKRSRPLGRGKFAQRRATNEVQANAALNRHRNVVRYYSAWMEEDRMSIQQEYCNGGDLAYKIATMRQGESFFEESELKRMLLHVADGLSYIHATKLAHMDIKPENIFIAKEQIWASKRRGSYEDSDDSTKFYYEEETVYKIGDLGHVASILNTRELEDEGDCRYLSKEILREDYSDLAKADVFALGLTIYEAAGGGPLPKNGPAWHGIRDGNLKKLTRYSDEFNELLRVMTHSDPEKRPSAAEIMRYKFLFTDGSMAT